MRRLCLLIALLGPIACGSEYIPKTRRTTASDTGGAANTDAMMNTGGVLGAGGSPSSPPPSQGGSEAIPTTVAVGSAGSTSVASGGNTAATGGTTASAPTNTNVAGAAFFNCNLPQVTTGISAKPSGSPGNLKVMNWAGYRAAVSFTMDDAMLSQINHYAELQALGIHYTFFLWTNKAEASSTTWAQAVKDGHELGNHTAMHTQLAKDADVEGATEFIETRYGVHPWSLAAPYGDMSYADYATGKFLLNRGVWEGLAQPNASSTSQYNLPCTIPEEGALATTMNPLIDSAQSAGGWRILLVHGFKDVADGAYHPVDFNEFAATVIHAKALGDVWIDSMVNIGSYWVAQKVLSQVQPTTSGSEVTYTWKLPDPFPPGKCVRATVSGGTVRQNGRVLEWDSHGYYEISLDAGSVTISP